MAAVLFGISPASFQLRIFDFIPHPRSHFSGDLMKSLTLLLSPSCSAAAFPLFLWPSRSILPSVPNAQSLMWAGVKPCITLKYIAIHTSLWLQSELYQHPEQFRFWAFELWVFTCLYIYATVCVTHAHVLVGVRVDSEYLLALLLTYLLRQSLSLELIANQYCLSSWPVSARKPLYLLSKTGNIGGLCLPRFNVGSGNLNSGVCVWTSYVTMEQLPVFFSFNFNFRISNSSYFSNSLCRITNN